MKKLKKNPRTGYKIIRRCTRANFRNRTFWDLQLANKRKEKLKTA